MSDRIDSLFKILARSKGYVSVDTLCAQMGIRPRTLREDIRKYKNFLSKEAGVRIDMKSNRGYILNILDEDKYYGYLKQIIYKEASKQTIIPVFQEDRVSYIIRYFLGKNDYIKSDDLAEELFVSRSTLSADLRLVKAELANYELTLESRVGLGLKIAGEERKIRSCMSDYYFYKGKDKQVLSIRDSLGSIKLSEIADLLYDVIHDHQFKMNDIGFQNLVIHLAIAIFRVRENTYVDVHDFDGDSFTHYVEYDLAIEIVRRLNKIYHVSFPRGELIYIAMHLMGKRIYSIEDDQVIHVNTLNLVNKILEAIKKNTDISLYGDADLFTALALHIQPLLTRLNYDMKLHNPLMEAIKKNNLKAFDLAVLAGIVINEETNCHVDEDELGYFALHFELALNRMEHQDIGKQRIIVVCPSGAGTAKMLLHKIKQVFAGQIENIQTMSAFSLRELDPQDWDLIVSTVPLNDNHGIPSIHVSYSLNDEDIQAIRRAVKDEPNKDAIIACFNERFFFGNMNFTSRNQVIDFMCDKITHHFKSSERFKELVYEREEIASTDLGNGIAMPHPGKLVLEENIVCVCHLENPVQWGKSKVNLVFLVGMSKHLDFISETLQHTLLNLFNDVSALLAIQNDPSFATFKTYLSRAIEHEIDDDIFK